MSTGAPTITLAAVGALVLAGLTWIAVQHYLVDRRASTVLRAVAAALLIPGPQQRWWRNAWTTEPKEIIMASEPNPDQPPPPPKGPCPSGGQHNWVTSGHIRTCTKCNASEVVH